MSLYFRKIADRIGLKRYSTGLLITIGVIVAIGYLMGSIFGVVVQSLLFSPIYFAICWWRKELTLRGFLDGLIIFGVVICLGTAYDKIRLRSIEETEISTVNEAQAYFKIHGRYPIETHAQNSSLWSESIDYASAIENKDGTDAMVGGIYLWPFGEMCYFLKNGEVSGPVNLD